MKRVEVHIAEGEGNRRLGTLEYAELRGKEVSSFELDALLRNKLRFYFN